MIFLSFRKRRRLILQMAAAALFKPLAQLDHLAYLIDHALRDVETWATPSIKTEIWYWVCRLLPSAQWQFARPQERFLSTNKPGSISRNNPRRRTS